MKSAIATLLGIVISLVYVVFASRSYVYSTRTGYIYEPATQRLFAVGLHRPYDRLNYWKPLLPEVIRAPTLLDGEVISEVTSLPEAIAAECDVTGAARKADGVTTPLASSEPSPVSTFTYRVRNDVDAGSLLPDVWKHLPALQSWSREVLPVDVVITEWPADTALQPRIEHIPESLFIRGGPSLRALEERGLDLTLCGLAPGS